jgi:YfiH family protein
VSGQSVIIPDWPAPAAVRAVVTTRSMPGNSQPPYDSLNLGLRSGEDEHIVRANRALLERALKLPSPPRWLQQVHGDRSLRVTEEIFDGEQQADAVFTTQPDIVLAILTADCLPILLCADDGSEIGAIHAGWRGLSCGIIESTIARLRTPRSKLLAWLGPAIGRVSYEVGDDVRDAFVAKSSGAMSAFEATRPGHWLCDLYSLARQRLRTIGVEKIFSGNFDTLADARFYSYRRDGAHSGRFASLIWLHVGT